MIPATVTHARPEEIDPLHNHPSPQTDTIPPRRPVLVSRHAQELQRPVGIVDRNAQSLSRSADTPAAELKRRECDRGAGKNALPLDRRDGDRLWFAC